MQRLIDFNLEITKGCKYNCTGCKVDKENNQIPSTKDFDRLDNLIDELNSNKFSAMNLALGPTDILTSENREQVLTSSRLKNFAAKFLKTSINCAFLEPTDSDYINLGKKLNWLLEDKMVKFVVPFEVFHIDNDSYIDKIKERIALTLSYMPRVVHTKTYLVMNYETVEIYDKKNKTNLTDELIFKINNNKNLGDLDLGIYLPQTRQNLRNDYISLMFRDAIDNIKHKLTKARDNFGADKISIAEIDSQEGMDWDITYKNGKLYLTPFLLEGLVCFDQVFEVTNDWTLQGIFDNHNDMITDQLIWADTIDDCKSCNLRILCAERGVHNLMKISQSKTCISPAKNLEKEIIWYRNI